MKKNTSVCLAMVGCLAVAGILAAPKPQKEMSPEKKAKIEARREAMLKANGGFLLDRRTGKGMIAIFDAQSKVSRDVLVEHAKKLENFLGLNVRCVVCTNKVDLLSARKVRVGAEANAAVFLVETADMPTVVSLPEERCAFVNVTALCKDNPDSEKMLSRVRKEVSRGIAFIFGCPYSKSKGSILDTFESLEDLDRTMIEGLVVDQRPYIDFFSKNAFGMTRFRLSNYRIACQEGWAPEPSNEYQKAIWKEVHELPSEPIKIEK